MAAFRCKTLLLLAGFAATAAAPLRAQSTPAPQITEATANDLGHLRALTEARNYKTALSVIDNRLAAVPAESYDRIILLQIKLQIFLAEGDYAAALPPVETIVALGDRHANYLPETTRDEFRYLLAQLYQQRGSEARDPLDQRLWLDKSVAQLLSWQAGTGKRTSEGQLFAASLLYQRATLDSKNIDKPLLAQARRAAEEGLLLKTKPSPSLYAVILAVLQHSDDFKTSADLLELMLAENPAQSAYAQQLVACYLNLAATAPAPREAARYNLRAILAMERAQARGALASPRENYNLVALYLAVDQHAKAIALLEKGLADGTLENTRRNWEILANACQQSQREDDAIAALEKAVAKLPAEGQLEFMLAQLLHGKTRVADARLRLESAIAKDRLEKPGQARLFLAYVCFELQDFDTALRRAGEADRFDDVKNEDVKRLAKAITEAAKTRADNADKS